MHTRIDELIPTRQSLLSRLKDWDDQESWREFFELYWRLIHGLAVKCGLTEAEAQDVVQETMISVAKQMPGFKYDPAVGKFKGWLLQITRRSIADQFRKREKAAFARSSSDSTGESAQNDCGGLMTADHTRTDTVERVPDPADQALEKLWDEEWRSNLLLAALERVKRRVSPKQFQMFDLYVTQQWPMDLVTSTLGVNAAQVYMAKMRVSRLMRKELKAVEARGL
ncbi:MAG: sigma-70 family RNA polymerase sigma factor [Pedosphaera sp.]|nr:sigma-70 family RNA polymerase sigma factor [Pedosphaera sp.]